MAENSAPRSATLTSAESRRTAPWNPAPNPSPATTSPSAKTAMDVSTNATTATTLPTSSDSDAISISRCGVRPRSASTPMMPAPVKTLTTRPPVRWLRRPKIVAVTDGPSDNMKPPSPHVAIMTGIADTNAARRSLGTRTVGISERSTPG